MSTAQKTRTIGKLAAVGLASAIALGVTAGTATARSPLTNPKTVALGGTNAVPLAQIQVNVHFHLQGFKKGGLSVGNLTRGQFMPFTGTTVECTRLDGTIVGRTSQLVFDGKGIDANGFYADAHYTAFPLRAGPISGCNAKAGAAGHAGLGTGLITFNASNKASVATFTFNVS